MLKIESGNVLHPTSDVVLLTGEDLDVVNAQMSGKADKSTVAGQIGAIEGQIDSLESGKADKSTVAGQIGAIEGQIDSLESGKADKSTVETQIEALESSKADKVVVDTKANKVKFTGATIQLASLFEGYNITGATVRFDTTLVPVLPESKSMTDNWIGGFVSADVFYLIIHWNSSVLTQLTPDDAVAVDNGIYAVRLYAEDGTFMYHIIKTLYDGTKWVNNEYVYPGTLRNCAWSVSGMSSNIFTSLSAGNTIRQQDFLYDLEDFARVRERHVEGNFVELVTRGNVADYQPFDLFEGDILTYRTEPAITHPVWIYSIDRLFYLKFLPNGALQVCFDGNMLKQLNVGGSYTCIGYSSFDFTTFQGSDEDRETIIAANPLAVTCPLRFVTTNEVLTAISDLSERAQMSVAIKPSENYYRIYAAGDQSGIEPSNERMVWELLNPTDQIAGLPEGKTTYKLQVWRKGDMFWAMAWTTNGLMISSSVNQSWVPLINHDLEAKISTAASATNKVPATSEVSQMIQAGTSFKAALAHNTVLDTYIVVSGGNQAAYSCYALGTDFKIIKKYSFTLDTSGLFTSASIPKSDNPFFAVIDDRSTLTAGSSYDFSLDHRMWSMGVADAVNLTPEQQEAIDSGITSGKVSSYTSHLTNTSNPHSVTKAQVGLDKVDNTSDAGKPVSTAAQTALNQKVAIADIVDTLTSSDIDKPLSANQGMRLKGLIDNLSPNATVTDVSDDNTRVTAATQAIALWIQQYARKINGLITSDSGKVKTADVINSFDSEATDKPLAAVRGKELNDLLAALTQAVALKADDSQGIPDIEPITDSLEEGTMTANQWMTAFAQRINGILETYITAGVFVEEIQRLAAIISTKAENRQEVIDIVDSMVRVTAGEQDIDKWITFIAKDINGLIAADGVNVKLKNDQTVAGVKTFSDAPKLSSLTGDKPLAVDPTSKQVKEMPTALVFGTVYEKVTNGSHYGEGWYNPTTGDVTVRIYCASALSNSNDTLLFTFTKAEFKPTSGNLWFVCKANGVTNNQNLYLTPTGEVRYQTTSTYIWIGNYTASWNIQTATNTGATYLLQPEGLPKFEFGTTFSTTISGSSSTVYTWTFPYDLGTTDYLVELCCSTNTAWSNGNSWNKYTNKLEIRCGNGYSGSQTFNWTCRIYSIVRSGAYIVQNTLLDDVTYTVAGVLTAKFRNTPATVSIVNGQGTAIAGTWSALGTTMTFTPTTASQIVAGDWTVKST